MSDPIVKAWEGGFGESIPGPLEAAPPGMAGTAWIKPPTSKPGVWVPKLAAVAEDGSVKPEPALSELAITRLAASADAYG